MQFFQMTFFRRMITGVLCGIVSLLLIGCGGKAEHVLGAAPAKEATSDVKTLTAASVSGPVTLQGEMVEKCPVAGCWFMLKDKTGVVRVDTKAAGFVVSEVPLHTKMVVSGTVTKGTETGIAATGVRY